jgi:hypothetical protein
VIGASGDDRTVGLAGFYSLEGVLPAYPSFGPRLESRVNYVGRRLQDALLVRLDSREEFIDELAAKDPDLLVVGRDTPSEFDPDKDRPAPAGAELRWAQESGYDEVARSDRFIVLQRSPG